MTNQVLEIIKNRHHTGSAPGSRKDSYKLGLAVEGGGLRGIVTGGSLAALEALGLKSAFDVIYGSSCGAYTSSYFAGNDMVTGSRFFLNYSQVQFVGVKRYLRGGPLFDLDYVQQIMHTNTPLDYDAAIKSKPPLHVVATDASHSRVGTIKGFKNSYELDRALHATATIPPFQHPRPLLFRRHKYLDATILDPFCLNSAISEGCTHILVLFSLPWQHRKTLKLIDRKLVAPYLSKINLHLAEMYLNHGEYSVNGLSHVWNHYDGTHILTVAPAKSSKLPGQLTTNRRKLGHGFLAGAEATLRTFSPDEQTSRVIIDNFKRELKV